MKIPIKKHQVYGIRHHGPGSARALLQALEAQQPDLILLDMNFSRDTTSGQEGLDILSQLEPYNIPVILMTAWGSIELAVKGLQQGANDFIEKPWNKLIEIEI